MKFQQELEALYEKARDAQARGQSKESEVLESKAAAILQTLKDHAEHNPEDVGTASILLYLAEREWTLLGDHEHVLSRLLQALALRENHLGLNHPLTAEALTKVAEFHFVSGRFGEAEPLYRKALDVYDAQRIQGNPIQAKAFEGLAHTLAALGRAAEADPYFVQAIAECASDEQGKRSLYFLLTSRAEGLEKLNRPAEAGAARQKAAALLHKTNPGEMGFHV